MSSLQIGMLIGAALTVAIASLLSSMHGPTVYDALLDDGPTIIALIVASGSLLVSYRMFSEQKLMRQAGTDPVILVYLGSREDARVLSTLEIENVGAGAARNVMVKLLTDVSAYWPDRVITDFTQLKPIKTIPQGKSVSYNFGLGFKLLVEPAIPPLKFEVSYQDIEGNVQCDQQTIDVSELTGRRADDSLLSKISKSLEKIEKSAAKQLNSKGPKHVVLEEINRFLDDSAKERTRIIKQARRRKKD